MSDTDVAQNDISPPMIKEETVKDDGRTLIYYTFSNAQEALAFPNPLPEAAHV